MNCRIAGPLLIAAGLFVSEVRADIRSTSVSMDIRTRSDGFTFGHEYVDRYSEFTGLSGSTSGRSQLDWSSLQSTFATAEFGFLVGENTPLTIRVGHGDFTSGVNTDRDWNDRDQLWSHTASDASRGGVTSAAVLWSSGSMRWGGEWIRHEMTIVGGREILSTGRSLDDLRSSYDASQYRFIGGTRFERPIVGRAVRVRGEAELGLGYLRGEGNWNLRGYHFVDHGILGSATGRLGVVVRLSDSADFVTDAGASGMYSQGVASEHRYDDGRSFRSGGATSVQSNMDLGARIEIRF